MLQQHFKKIYVRQTACRGIDTIFPMSAVTCQLQTDIQLQTQNPACISLTYGEHLTILRSHLSPDIHTSCSDNPPSLRTPSDRSTPNQGVNTVKDTRASPLSLPAPSSRPKTRTESGCTWQWRRRVWCAQVSRYSSVSGAAGGGGAEEGESEPWCATETPSKFKRAGEKD